MNLVTIDVDVEVLIYLYNGLISTRDDLKEDIEAEAVSEDEYANIWMLEYVIEQVSVAHTYAGDKLINK
jgi:hypothetical protein